MGIITEYQVVITCDYCHDNLVEAFWRQKEAIAEARQMGWSIGKKVKCAECRKENNEGENKESGKTTIR